MNRPYILAAVAAFSSLLTMAGTTPAADTYTIDPTHTSIIFSVGHAGLSYTYGMFRTTAGSYVLDEANPAASRFKVVIQAESLFTNDAKRDQHLRGPDFFNVEQFPTIMFETTSCKVTKTPQGEQEYLLTGNLTLHGVTRQIEVPLRMLAKGLGPYKDQRTGFLCQLNLKRTDFNMNKLLENNLVGDAVSITISFEGFIATPNQPATLQ